jgi:hypothetical protein
MNSKLYILLGITLLGAAYATGRYMTPARVETKIVTVEKEIKVETKQTEDHSKTTIVIKKDGTKIITKQTDISTKDNSTTKTDIKQDSSKVTIAMTPSLNISLLAGIDAGTTTLVYGASISRNLIGPIIFGVWGLNNKTIGGSFGIQF